MRSACLIRNTNSGFHLENHGAGEDVDAALEKGGIELTTLSGSVDAQIAKSLERPDKMVIVDGGDGTIRAVIEAHHEGTRPIGIIPGGTMNLLAVDYGIPEDRLAAARVIADGHTSRVDVGMIGGRVFLHTALTGLAVRMGVHRENKRGSLGLIGKASLALHALTTLPRDPELHLEADCIDGRAFSFTSPSFAVVVGTLGERLLPRPLRDSVTKGELTVFALTPQTGMDVARLVMRGAFGVLAADADVQKEAIRAGTITGPRRRLHAMVDGESKLLSVPCRIDILPEAVAVFAPAAPSEGKPG